MFTKFIVPVFASLAATYGFTLIYNIRGKNAVAASFCGAFGWAVYLIFAEYTSSLFVPYLVSGIAIALYSELFAYFFKSPSTVYLIPGIIPLVPGLTIFRTMQSCLHGDLSAFAEGLVTTIKIGGAIVLGLSLMSSVFRLLRSGVHIFAKKLEK